MVQGYSASQSRVIAASIATGVRALEVRIYEKMSGRTQRSDCVRHVCIFLAAMDKEYNISFSILPYESNNITLSVRPVDFDQFHGQVAPAH